MRQKIELTPIEKKQESILFVLAIMSFLTLAKAFYDSDIGSNIDYFFPLLSSIYSCFFLIYGINGLANGNLVAKWNPGFLKIVQFLTKAIGSSTEENGKVLATKIIGFIGIIVSAFFIISIIKTSIINN